MRLDPDISSTAQLIADPRRATILLALMDGSTRPASELARLAGVTAQTASSHLGKLLRGGLLTLTVRGRNRFFQLASPEVASLIESISVASRPSMTLSSGAQAEARGLRFGRTCYDHLAGRLGVGLTATFVSRGLLELSSAAFTLTARGEDWFGALGLDLSKLTATRRPLVRACLDWSERKPHLAGALGAGVLTFALERKLLVRARTSRAVRVTDLGWKLFADWGMTSLE